MTNEKFNKILKVASDVQDLVVTTVVFWAALKILFSKKL